MAGRLVAATVVALGCAPGAAWASFPLVDTYPVGLQPSSVVAAQLDGAGGLDLATATSGASPTSASVLLRNGSVFGPPTAFAVDSNPVSIAAGDIDGDGHVDLVTADPGIGALSLLPGTGTGTFGPTQLLGAGNQPNAVAVANLDGDAAQEIVTASAGNANVVVQRDPTGPVAFDHYSLGGDQPQGMAVGDLDEDGHADVVTIAPNNHASATVPSVVGSLQAAAVTALNNVGLAVVRAAQASAQPVGTVLGQNVPASSSLPTGSVVVITVAAASSGPGGPIGAPAMSLSVVNPIVNGLSVSLNDGGGDLEAPVDYGTGNNAAGVAIGDIDGDGHLDVAETNLANNTVWVRFGDGTGALGSATSLATSTQPLGVAIGDFDGDGNGDVATANRVANTVSFFAGDGAGGFAPAANTTVGAGPTALIGADLDGDGDEELVTTNAIDGTVTVLGTPTLAPVGTGSPGSSSTVSGTTPAAPGATPLTPAGPVVTGSSGPRDATAAEIRAGLRGLIHRRVGRRAVGFGMTLRARGTVTWTVRSAGPNGRVLGTRQQRVGVGPLRVRIPLSAAGRRERTRNPDDGIVVEVQFLSLANQSTQTTLSLLSGLS